MVGYDDREWWVDYAKTIGIFLVVFIHLIQVNFGTVFSTDKSLLLFGTVFFMPLFFFVSGYLYKHLEPKMAFKKYFKRLVIPYIFFYIVEIIVLILYKNVSPDNILSVIANFLMGMVIAEPYSTISVANGTVWFLIALFNVIILFSLLKTYVKEDKYILASIIGFNVLLYLLHLWKINLYFTFDSALLGIGVFYVGYLSKKHNIMDYFKNNYVDIVLVMIFFVIAYGVYIYNGVLGLRGATWGGNFIIAYFGAFAGIIMVVALSSILARFKNKIIFLISINTLTIMGLDQPLRLVITLLFREPGLKNIPPLFKAFAIAIIVIGVAVIIALFLNKYAPVLIGNKGKFRLGMFQKLYIMIKNKGRPRLGS